ncbi:PREDICTED: BAG domain-containing protein Samui-like [Nicotiana attenuata]|uniref:BAG domain-containing protein Samui-like n=1 Tax=Nicotiana attenuata TaxID=49451 RepID=UPI0009050FCC|nr:PREDICTED: BAG domain-containing protein Samui-like [Nicotiana attenuata]
MLDNTVTESSQVRSLAVNLSPNPKEESPPHSTPFPTLSESTPPLSKSEYVCPPPVSPVEQSQQGEQGNLVQEPSTLSMAEHLSEERVTSNEETEISWTSDESEGITPSSVEIAMEPQEKEEIENTLPITSEGVIIEKCAGGFEPQGEGTEKEGEIVPFEQSAQDEATWDPNNEPDPSMEIPGQESSDQVSVDLAPSPHFDAEPLNMVVPETNPDSEENANDLVYASFIRDRTKPVVTLEPPPKRPTTRLQQKEALEFTLKKSKKSRRRRRLVKDGKVVQVEDVPVVDVDEETKEEPSSLSRKSSRKKHSLSQSQKHTYKGAECSSKSDVTGSSKKLEKSFGDKTVKERGDKSDEEEVEKSGEHR